MKRLLLLIFTFLSFYCLGQGNMITINSSVPAQMTVCGVTKTFTIAIYNPSPFLLTSDTLKLSMPPGINYVLGSITGTGITELNTTIPNKPVFLLPDIPTLTSLNITYIAETTCDVMPYLSGGGVIENNVRVNYFANGTSNFDAHTTSSYIIRQPNLSISSFTNQSYIGSVGNVYERCVTITNGGFGELSAFTLTDVHGSGIQITSISKGTWTHSGTTETVVLNASDFATIGDFDNLFENGESIIICDSVKILNCISVASAFEAYWGCNNQHCQSSTSNANIVFPNLIPNLVVTPIASMNSCIGAGNASQQQLKIVNSGLGKAMNVLLDIFQSTNSGYNNIVGSDIDPASFTVQSGLGGVPSSITPVSTQATSLLSCMAVGVKGKVLLSIPVINPGETIYVKWNSYSCCHNSCTNVGQSYINGWRFKGTYENVCLSSYVIPEAWGRVYSQIYGNLSNNGSPSTMSSGQTGTFNFLFSNFTNSYPAGPGAYWKMEFTLPPCLTYAGNEGSLYILRSNGVDTWIPSSVTTVGNVVTAIFNGALPAWTSPPAVTLQQAEVKINLTVNCAGCGGSGSGAVSVKSFYVPNSSCACELGISCQSTSISVLCPSPCPEGMVFSYYEMKRTSYGLPDNEANGGDGLPDIGGSLDFTKIKTDRVMFGDTITANFTGVVKTSIAHPSWQYCYAVSSVANGNRISFVDATLKIYRAGVLLTTCNSIVPTVTTSGTTRVFKYNLNVTALGSCFTGPYSNSDSVVFKPRYRVSSNVGNSAPLNCYATNEYYLSDIANPTLAANKFQCGNYNGSCSIIGYYFTSEGANNYSVKSCNDVTYVTQNYYLSIGPCCNNYAGGNLFPYEYRNWSHISILKTVVPPGYDFISARFNQIRTTGTITTLASPSQAITPVNPNSDTLVFLVEPYFQGYGGTIPLSDDGFHGTLDVIIRPSCEVTPTLSKPITHDWTFTATPNNYLTGTGSASLFVPRVQDSIIYEAPILFLQSTLPSINAPNIEADWEVSVSNLSNVSNALNTWLGGPAISGITITQLYDIDNGAVIIPVGSIYQVGTVNAGATRHFRITATFTSCAKDSIIVYSGWNCNGGYPSSVSTYPCTPKKITLSLTPLMPALVVNVTAPPSTIQLCDTATYTIEGVNVQLGTAYEVALVSVLPLGVSIVPGTSKLRYPVSTPYLNISDPVFMGGTTWKWDITASSSLVGADGLKGILESTLNSFNLTFKVVTTCGYTSGSTIAFNLKGIAACGEPTGQEVALSSQLGITGATTPYTTSLKLQTTYISPCAGNSAMHVSVRNQGPMSFSITDSVLLVLPAGVSYVPLSFSGIRNPPLATVPLQYILNGSVHLRWKLPSGVVAGDSTVFDFNYQGDADVLTCAITEFEALTTSSTNVTCTQSGQNCGINIATGDTALSVFTYKAYLSLSNGTIASVPNPPLGETVTVNLDIVNTGQAITTGDNSVLQFYYDNNSNGIYNTGDALLMQDTLLITNNSTVQYTNTFNVPAGQACRIIAIIRSAVNPCVCNPSEMLLSPRLITLGNDSTICSTVTMTLSGPPITGYIYSWSPVTGLSNAAIANPVLTASNLTSLPVSTNYIQTTTRGTCISKDTIRITVNPLPVSNAGADITSCQIGTPGNLGVASTIGYSYSWLPSTGLSSTVISNPTASLTTAGTTTYTVTTTALGCNKTDDVIVKVNPLPTAVISGNTTVCKGASSPNVSFTGAAGTPPYTFTYKINSGSNQTVTTTSGSSVTVAVPTTAAGTFTYALVSVKDASSTLCTQAQTGSAVVIVNPLPTAVINGNAELCEGSAAPNITFTGAGSTAPYTFTYTINGGANQTVTTTIGNSVTVASSTLIPGTYIYSLVSVQDASSTTCSQVQTGTATVKVNPLPTAVIAGTIAVCQNTASQNITFTGASGTAPYTFTYSVNSGASQTVTTSSGNSVTITVPTTSAGTFIYTLGSVKDASSTLCSQPQTGSATVTINPLPTATINGTIAVCKNDNPPNITFTGASGTAPYTFIYTINGGSNQTVSTTSGNNIMVSAPTTATGTYVYALVSVQDASSTACLQAQSGSAAVTVNSLPSATITGTAALCKNSPSPNVTFTGSGGTAPYTFTYTINSGIVQTASTTSGSSVSVSASTSIAGAYTYALVSIQDVNGCSQTQSGSVTVTVNPLPTAIISGTASICQGGGAPVITFTGGGSVAPYTFTYNLNGIAQPPLTTTSGNSTTILVSTVGAGTFAYQLVSVQDASSTSCSQLQTESATVIVNPLPTATITGTTAVCKDAAPPNITFTGAGGTAPYLFTYKINNGSNLLVTTTIGSSVDLPVLTNTTGTYTYTLISVKDASSSTCSQIQTGTATITVNPLPTATITGSTAVCKNAPSPNIIFTGANGTAPYSFIYTINGVVQPAVISTGNSAALSVPTSIANTLTYVLLSVQDASSTACTQLQSGSAVVIINSLPAATISGDTEVCRYAGSPNITFTGSNGTAPYTFIYKINGGVSQSISTISGNSISIAVPTGTVGTFSYALISVMDGSSTTCSQSQPDTSVIVVNPLPTANYSVAPVCLNQPVNYNDLSNVSSGSIVSWSWNFGDSSPLGITSSPVYLYASAGTFTSVLIVTTSKSCKDTATTNVVVHPLPIPSFSTANVCDGDSVLFNNQSSIAITDAIASQSWNFGDNSPFVSTQHTFHEYNTPGVYPVELKVVSNFGCIDSVTKIVTVNPVPVVNFTTDKIIGCESLCINFQDLTTVLTGTNAQWTWSLGDTVINAITGFEHCYSNDSVTVSVNYSIALTVTSDSGCVNTLTKNNLITVYPKPEASFTVQPATATIIEPVVSVLDASSGTNFWLWDFGDQGAAGVVNPAPHTYADTGHYTITLITTTQFGCKDTAYQSVIIEPDFTFFIPNAFTPDADGINDSFSGKGIYIKTYEMQIFDRWGNLVFKTEDIDIPWDGRANNGNEIAQRDVYVYVVKITDFKDRKHKYRGTVTLVK